MKRRKRLSHENRIFLFALLAGLPGSLIALCFLWFGNLTPKVQWTLTILIVSFWIGYALALRSRVIYPLQTISNLLAALREGDYSIRAKKTEDALGEVLLEVNALGDTLRDQRLGALEASALLRAVMAQIEVAVFAFDHQHHLRLVNRAGERLLGKPTEQLLDQTAEELNLRMCLEGDAPRTLEMAFAGTVTRWEMHRSTFRQGGLPHQLIVLSDLSRALREEERLMWQRLIRVLGHELNNSLAPIKSIAGSLEKLIQSEIASDCQDDIRRGLSVIASRAEALSKFMGAYARLARLPQPQLQTMDVKQWITRVISLETRIPIQIQPGPHLVIQGDPDQLEQLLINLLQNAVDAALETGGGVQVGWVRSDLYLEVWIEDEGPGIASTSNLFVPFFTTKTGGTGIGLVLSRQIAEAHGGTVSVSNSPKGKGCLARLRLPLQQVSIPSPVAI